MTSSPRATRLLVLALLAGLVASVFAAMQHRDMPDRDAGVFLYVGARLLQGNTPYVDIWDHKGPLIYFINALGVALDPGGERGVWLLEVMALLGSGWLLYRALRPSLGHVPSLTAMVLFFGALVLVIGQGNYTEEFALPLAMIALFVSLRHPERTPGRTGLFVIGLALGGTLLLRLNLVGIEVAVVLYVLGSLASREGVRACFEPMAWISLGAAAATLPFVAFFADRHALAAVWDAYVRFNFVYLQQGELPPLGTVWRGLSELAPAGLPIVSIVAWFLAAAGLASRRLAAGAHSVLIVGMIALPLELTLTAISGRDRHHYFIAWLPAMAILCAWAAYVVEGYVRPRPGSGSFNLGMLAGAVLAGGFLVVPGLITSANVGAFFREGLRDTGWIADELSPYEGDEVLMWGAEAAYNYHSERPSPSRYVYQYPLYVCGYVTPAMVDSFRADIEGHLPLIIDTSSTNRQVPPLDPQTRAKVAELGEACALSPGMVDLMNDIWDTYREVGRLPTTGWIVYQPDR